MDNIQGVGDVPVPDGWFRSARRDGKSRREEDLPKSVVAKRLSQAPMEGVIPTTEPVTHPPSHSSVPVYKHFPTSVEDSHLRMADVPPGRKIAYSLPSPVEHPNNNSAMGVRQTTYSVPNGMPFGRPQPQHHESLPVPSPSVYPPSPSSTSSSSPATPSPRMRSYNLSEKLVPLEYLQSLPHPRRHPHDEQLLQRFSSSVTFKSVGSCRPPAGDCSLRHA